MILLDVKNVSNLNIYAPYAFEERINVCDLNNIILQFIILFNYIRIMLPFGPSVSTFFGSTSFSSTSAASFS